MNAAAKPVRPKSDIAAYMHERGARARVAARRIARADTGTKNAALFALAQAILDDSDAILEANAQDMRAGRNAKLDAALLERLELNAKRVEAMADGVRQVALLPDPVGEITDKIGRASCRERGCQYV